MYSPFTKHVGNKEMNMILVDLMKAALYDWLLYLPESTAKFSPKYASPLSTQFPCAKINYEALVGYSKT